MTPSNYLSSVTMSNLAEGGLTQSCELFSMTLYDQKSSTFCKVGISVGENKSQIR